MSTAIRRAAGAGGAGGACACPRSYHPRGLPTPHARVRRGMRRPAHGLGPARGCPSDGGRPMAITRLNHAVLYVSDVERSAAFYRDVLGFRTVMAMRGAAFLQAPGSTNDHDLGLFEIG